MRRLLFSIFLWQDFLGAISVLCCGIITVISAVEGMIPPGYVGLAIAYALKVSDFLSLLTKLMADLEMQMNAVERVQYYTKLPTESCEGIFLFLLIKCKP